MKLVLEKHDGVYIYIGAVKFYLKNDDDRLFISKEETANFDLSPLKTVKKSKYSRLLI